MSSAVRIATFLTLAQMAMNLSLMGCAGDEDDPARSGALLEVPPKDSPSTDAGSFSADTGRLEERACGELDLEQCGKAAHCSVFHGRRVDEQHRCFAERAPVGCGRRADLCDDSLGYVRDSQGTIWMFSNLCLPEGLEQVYEDENHPWGGWSLCDPLPSRPSDTRCSELSTSLCASEPVCRVIMGTQYDPARRCRWLGNASIGCMQADLGCPAAVLYARLPGDAIAFEIAEGCLPAKFEPVSSPGHAVSSLPICPEAAP